MLQFLLSFVSGLIVTLVIFFAGYVTALYQVWMFERKQEQELLAKQTRQKRNVKKNEKA